MYSSGVGETSKPPHGIRERREALKGTAEGREGNDEKVLAERNEIVRVVRSKNSILAWVTDKGVVIYNPNETKQTLLVGADRSILDAVDKRVMEAGVDVPLAIVEGISGLAATDPEWDGQETFQCQNPDCPEPVRSVDETCYLNLWKRSRKLMN